MAPRRPKKADVSTFPGWDELVAEANIDKPPYELPLPGGKIVHIPVPSGAAYLTIVDAQKRGDASTIFRVLFPEKEQPGMQVHFARAHFPIMDVIANKVLGYFYGLDNYASLNENDSREEAEEAAGESDGS